MRLRLVPWWLVALVLLSVWTIWIRNTYGIELAWQTPKRILICDRRYDPVDPSVLAVIKTGTVLDLQPFLFAAPVPLPDLHPFDSSAYGGCPSAVVIHRKGEELVFAPMSGGP